MLPTYPAPTSAANDKPTKPRRAIIGHLFAEIDVPIHSAAYSTVAKHATQFLRNSGGDKWQK
jgi:hypothetical protein